MSCLISYQISTYARETLFNLYKCVDPKINESSMKDSTLLNIIIDSYNEYVAKHEDDSNSTFVPNNKKVKDIIISRKVITNEMIEVSRNYTNENHNIFKKEEEKNIFDDDDFFLFNSKKEPQIENTKKWVDAVQFKDKNENEPQVKHIEKKWIDVVQLENKKNEDKNILFVENKNNKITKIKEMKNENDTNKNILFNSKKIIVNKEVKLPLKIKIDNDFLKKGFLNSKSIKDVKITKTKIEEQKIEEKKKKEKEEETKNKEEEEKGKGKKKKRKRKRKGKEY